MQGRKRNAPARIKVDDLAVSMNEIIHSMAEDEPLDCSSYQGLRFDLPFLQYEVNFYPSLGGQIESLNRNLPWYTQKHAANMLGISVKWYRAHLTGEREFTLDNLARWSILTGFPAHLPLLNTRYYSLLQHSELNFWNAQTLRLYAEVSRLPEYRFRTWLACLYSFKNFNEVHTYRADHALVDIISHGNYDSIKEHYLGTVCSNMAIIRETCGFSVDEIVEAMQISREYYLSLESGEKPLKASDVIRFSLCTGIPMIKWASGTLYKRIRERHDARLNSIHQICKNLNKEEFEKILAFSQAYIGCASEFPGV